MLVAMNTAHSKRPRSFASLPVFTEYPYVPQPGTWGEFTLNTAYSPGVTAPASILSNWCGGCYIPDAGEHGSVCYQGGGEHWVTNDYGGVLVLDIKARMYRMACIPAAAPHVQPSPSGPPSDLNNYGDGDTTDIYGAYPDGSPQSKHTYNGIQEMPSAWGGGPLGSVVRVAHTGGPSSNPPGVEFNNWQGYSATWKFDISQAVNGHSKLTGEQTYTYGNGPAWVNDAPSSGVDYQRQGWWSKPRTGPGFGGRLCFTSKTGVITSYPTPLLESAWAQIHHFEDGDDLLVVLTDHVSNGPLIYVTIPPDMPGSGWVAVNQINPPVGPTTAYIGYMGVRWCSHPNIMGFVGLDTHIIDSTHIRIWICRPPPVGQRVSGDWVWTSEIVTSGDGSPIDVFRGPPDPSASYNGTYGKLVYCPQLQCLVWTTDIYSKGQLIRLADMHGDDEPPEDPDPPGPTPSRSVKVSGDGFGTDYVYASRALQVEWENPGGDWSDSLGVAQGTTPHSSQAVIGSETSTLTYTFDISGIDGDIHLRFSNGTPFFTEPKIDGALISSPEAFYVQAGSLSIWGPPYSNAFKTPAFIRNPQRGSVFTIKGYYTPASGNFLVDKVREVVVTSLPMVSGGIAATVASDAQLETHPSVLKRLDFTSEPNLRASIMADGGEITEDTTNYPDHPLAFFPQYLSGPNGLPTFRFRSWDEPRIVQWYANYTPPQEEVYQRYCLYIEDDVYDGINELGVKLPGVGHRITADEVSWRTHHGPKAPNNRGLWMLNEQRYSAESGGGFGFMESFNAVLHAGVWYSIEQYFKYNTVGVANGEGKVWVNGNLTWESNTLIWRLDPASRMFVTDVVFYHGGIAKPLFDIHYRIGGLVVATQYIGPPKEFF